MLQTPEGRQLLNVTYDVIPAEDDFLIDYEMEEDTADFTFNTSFENSLILNLSNQDDMGSPRLNVAFAEIPGTNRSRSPIPVPELTVQLERLSDLPSRVKIHGTGSNWTPISSAAAAVRSVTPTRTEHKTQVVTIPVQPTQVSNKSTMCKAITLNKAIHAVPNTADAECQTEDFLEKTIILPVPIPIFVPQPMMMYNMPIPLPVPVFIPTTRNSASGNNSSQEIFTDSGSDTPTMTRRKMGRFQATVSRRMSRGWEICPGSDTEETLTDVELPATDDDEAGEGGEILQGSSRKRMYPASKDKGPVCKKQCYNRVSSHHDESRLKSRGEKLTTSAWSHRATDQIWDG